MKYLITLFLLSSLYSGIAQTDQELIKAVVEFEDVKKFLAENVEGEIFLVAADGYVSLQDDNRTSSLDANQSKLTLERIIEEGDVYKLRFNIDNNVHGKVKIVAIQDELKVRRVSLKAGEGKNKAKMLSLEF